MLSFPRRACPREGEGRRSRVHVAEHEFSHSLSGPALPRPALASSRSLPGNRTCLASSDSRQRNLFEEKSVVGISAGGAPHVAPELGGMEHTRRRPGYAKSESRRERRSG